MVGDEFSFIQRHFASLKHAALAEHHSAGVILGIGDDAAIIAMQGNYAITTDTLVEKVHFFSHINPRILGARSLEVNFSDVYAMGARPNYITLSLDLPARYLGKDDFWHEFAQGVEECLERHNCLLIGGNITHCSHPEAPLTISVTAFGKNVTDAKNLRRDGACLGDAIYVTGTLGANGLYVKSVYDGTIKNLTPDEQAAFEAHSFSYDAQMAQLISLIVKYSSCGIDVSDGLLGDLSHILMQSHCRAELNYEALPLDAMSRELLPRLSLSTADLLKLALSAGGDYNLVFTVPSALQEAFETELRAEIPALACTCIGKVVAAKSEQAWGQNFLATDGGLITLVDAQGKPVSLDLGHSSYNHFLAATR